VLSVVDVRDFGAVGDGAADDTAFIQAAVDAVQGQGGVVWFSPGSYRTSDILRIDKDKVKLWSANGQAGLISIADGVPRRQAVVVTAANVGIFGLRFNSDADRRLTALEDSAVALDGAVATEVVGLEITNSASAAVFVFGASRETYVDGNAIVNTWADGVHFTDGSQQAWVWNNGYFTEAPTNGDDGVACVSYGSGPRCGRMEWWNNTHYGSSWGRGLAVVGGEDIDIHHNVVVFTGAAGILVASEPSFDTSGSERIRIRDNVVIGAGHAVPHPAILVSALDGAISHVVIDDNVVVDDYGYGSFRVEGDVSSIDHQGTTVVADAASIPGLTSARDRPVPKDTTVLATRDTSSVDDRYRPGLYRVQLRPDPASSGFQQRFEYVVTGEAESIERWSAGVSGIRATFVAPDPGNEGDHEQFLVLRTGEPTTIPHDLHPVGFAELRRVSATLPDLWAYLDEY
jgi:hypothetical protein